MKQFTDQLGNTISLEKLPTRIVSIVPSQTELLYDLGLQDEVVGITKFCVHPQQWFSTKTRVGGTKTLDTEKIKQLRPDLTIANKEENVKDQIELLGTIAPTWVSDINNLDDALAMITSIGAVTGKTSEAKNITDRIAASFQEIVTTAKRGTAYLIWKDPYMTVGGDTFIHDMLQHCGLVNIFAQKQRYPAIILEELIDAGCELVLLSSEPYPFREKHIAEISAVLPDAKILLVDGEMFSWYGSRLQHAPGYFRRLLADL
jgi:ABC-type Fe3+-hydroxamate transport system substrate-binding protein